MPEIPQTLIDAARNECIATVARELGVSLKKSGGYLIGPCPICSTSASDDRFSINVRKNFYFCRKCAGKQGGGPIDLVSRAKGYGFREAVSYLTNEDLGVSLSKKPRKRLKVTPPNPEKVKKERENKRRYAFELWKKGAYSPVIDDYFSVCRGLNLAHDNLRRFRYLENLVYKEFYDKKWRVIHEGPVILAPIIGRDGRFLAVHRAWIDIDNPKGKAKIIHPKTGKSCSSKKVMGEFLGGHVPLSSKKKSGKLIVGEGYESVFACEEMNGLNDCELWGAVTLGNLVGKAHNTVVHASKYQEDEDGNFKLDDKGNPIRQRVQGPQPDFRDNASLIIPPQYDLIYLANDFDGDAFSTKAASMRGKARHERLGAPKGGREVVPLTPSFNHDWNSLLMSERGLHDK